MKQLFLFSSIILLFFSHSVSSNSKEFEGNISFVRESVFDTTRINILVKGNYIRVDEYNNQNVLLSSHLINLPEEKVIAISHEQKLYTNVPVVSKRETHTSNLSIRKTENHKEINGHICYQWRVKDIQRNTEIAYWVAEERFSFFETLLRLLNRTEHSLKVFCEIPNSEGFFPFLTEERTLLRKDKLRIGVVEINEKNLNPALFQIPEGYKAVRI
jgi:hypothetical protein